MDKKGTSFTKYLKTFISEDLKNNIKILGAIPHDEIPDYIEKAHVCVFPSHMEAMPIAWLEALSMGKILIAGDIGPGREAIINGVTGVLVNPFKITLLASVIIDVLNNVNSNMYGKAARKDIISRFNAEHIISKNIQYYNQILS
jgi:glycosyltransferase involved in cell wall biosynthesis